MNKVTAKEVPWNLKDVGEAIVVITFLVVVAYFARLLLLDVPAFRLSRPLAAFVSFFLIYALLVSVVWLYAVKKYKGTIGSLGVRGFKWWQAVRTAFLWLIAIKFFTIVYAAAASAVGFEAPPEVTENITRLFGADYVGIVLAVVTTVVIAPIAEELFFRGFLYPAFRKRVGIWWATLLSAVVFALFHPGIWLFVPIALIGIILAGLYEKWGSLGPPVILHAFNNLFSLAVLYYYR